MLSLLPFGRECAWPTAWIAAAVIGAMAVAAPMTCHAGGQSGATSKQVKIVRIHRLAKASAISKRVVSILSARIQEYSKAQVVSGGRADLDLYLAISPGIGTEGFKISDKPRGGGIVIAGNDERGLLYGVGKFLHTSVYSSNGLTPSSWRGASVPKCPVRGIYLATHMHNYYEDAPIDEVARYMEDLALWGVNSYLVWFDTEVYDSFDDPKAKVLIQRLRALLKTAKDLGMNVSLGSLCNDGYKTSPVELRADKSTVNHAGYHTKMGDRIFGIEGELCISKPGVPEMELGFVKEKFDAFKDIGLDYWFLAPYDTGGCTCAECAPWGCNGYLRMGEQISRAFKAAFPKGKLILSTWYFDRWAYGEWEGISEKFGKKKPDWVDYIMADDYGGKYPEYPLVHGSPGGLPLLNFPEISMYNHYPWGGFGANPLPNYLQSLWDVTKNKLSGGFPYSEGYYEDMNKVIVAQLYWDPAKPTSKTVREYIAFHFSSEVVNGVSRAIDIMERNLERHREDKDGVTRYILKHTEGAEEAFRLVADADAKLPVRVRKSWRWRIVYLRGMIDADLVKHDFRVTPRCVAAFKELTTLYHCENAYDMMRPPHDLSGVLPSDD